MIKNGTGSEARREARGGATGLHCGEANPNQWGGVEPNHWGGPQGQGPLADESVLTWAPTGREDMGLEGKREGGVMESRGLACATERIRI